MTTSARPGPPSVTLEGESAELYRLLVQSVKDYAIFILDPEGCIASWNEGAQRITGYRAEEIVGQSFTRFYPQEAIVAGFPQYELEVAAHEGRFEDEGWRLRKDGTRFWANVVITALHDDDRRLVGFAKVTRDLTARRQAEEQARRLAAEEAARAEAEAAIRARDEFVALVSHDLRNPLTAIAGQLQLLRRRVARGDVPDAEQLLGKLTAIERSVLNLAAIVDDLDDTVHLASGQAPELARRPTDLVALVRDALAVQKLASDSHRFRLVAGTAHLTGMWDARRVVRVLANLLSNAVKYSRPGSEVTVEVHAQGDGAVLTVRDQGIGIPAEDLPHIFERYRRASNVIGRYSGTGLGLAGAGDIVDAHGGSISVESVEGQGATVTVRLPLAIGAVDAPAPTANHVPCAAGSE